MDIQGISTTDLKPGGLYLIFEDGTRLDFVHDEIRVHGYKFLDDPSHVPDNVKKAAEFQRCSVCPERQHPGYCHALLPVLSCFDQIDKYPSCTPVIAIYKEQLSDSVVIRETSLQVGLQFISVLSLIHFCELGREYRDLFLMVNPIMTPREVAARIYLNILWQAGGDRQKALQKVEKFVNETKVTIKCQIDRLRLICENDAFLNAFIMTHVLTSFLEANPEELLNQYMAQYREKYI